MDYAIHKLFDNAPEASVTDLDSVHSGLAEFAYLLADIFGAPFEVGSEHVAKIATFCSTLPRVDGDCLGAPPGEFLGTWLEDCRILMNVENSLSLEESVYKAWTHQDGHPLRGTTGHCLGDPAAHMEAVLQSFGLTLDSAYHLAPDSLSTLFEFLGFLLENRPVQEVVSFCNDHLDWLGELGQSAVKRGAGSALECLISIADLFIQEVVDRLEKFDG